MHLLVKILRPELVPGTLGTTPKASKTAIHIADIQSEEVGEVIVVWFFTKRALPNFKRIGSFFIGDSKLH
jgi:hypothetical protein